MNSETAVRNVKPDVRIVRLKVWLMLRFTMSTNEPRTPQLEIFTNAVKRHDGVVHRITDQREKRGDHRKIDLLIKN